MRIHAIQTGTVKIKTAQVEGHGQDYGGSSPFTPIGTGLSGYRPMRGRSSILKASSSSTPDKELICSKPRIPIIPFMRWEVVFRIESEEEIGPQLRALGIGPRDVKKVVLTHLHMDHDGGLAHFPNSEILVSSNELRTASGWADAFAATFPIGGLRGSIRHRLISQRDRLAHSLSASD